MRIFYRVDVSGVPSDAYTLAPCCVRVGPYDHGGGCFRGCVISASGLLRLEQAWGLVHWASLHVCKTEQEEDCHECDRQTG